MKDEGQDIRNDAWEWRSMKGGYGGIEELMVGGVKGVSNFRWDAPGESEATG